jgi:hypothetical protein
MAVTKYIKKKNKLINDAGLMKDATDINKIQFETE